MSLSWLRGKPEKQPSDDKRKAVSAELAATICLRVEEGLLMAFGPEGDPVPPALLRSLCADDPKGTLQMECGNTADRMRVLSVLDAQQKGQLSDIRSDGWIEAMLCLGGAFEPTPSELLDKEPLGVMPPPLEDGDNRMSDGTPAPDTEIMTPLVFEEKERRSMAKADAIMVHGLEPGVSLTAGDHDPIINSWVLRPKQLPRLAFQRKENAPKTAEIDVEAIMVDGSARRWSVTTRTVELA